jgi:hypothetical protein
VFRVIRLYSRKYQLYQDTSSSPVIDKATGKGVAINPIGNDSGEKRTENPYELDDAGSVGDFAKGYDYALQTSLCYDCLTHNKLSIRKTWFTMGMSSENANSWSVENRPTSRSLVWNTQ